MQAAEFLHHQVEALKKELQKKNEEIAEKDRLIQFYERGLKLRPVPKKEKSVKKSTQRYPACNKPLSELQLS